LMVSMSDELKERNILKLILIVRFACDILDVGHPICLEPLLKAVWIDCERFRTCVGPTEDRIGFAVQAYADDGISFREKQTKFRGC
jgi:hypothetical protein